MTFNSETDGVVDKTGEHWSVTSLFFAHVSHVKLDQMSGQNGKG
jgi:hypothetical protein